MKKRLAIILCLTVMLSMIPSTAMAKTAAISISPKALTLSVGDIAQLNVTNAKGKVTWKTSDKTIATVTSKGVVQGKADGTVTITVKDSKKKTAKCTVTVAKYVTDTNMFEAIKDKIVALFSEFTYSKSEIDKKISGVSGGTTVINNCNCNDKWSGTVTLNAYKCDGQELPLTYTEGDNKFTVNSIKVEKRVVNTWEKDPTEDDEEDDELEDEEGEIIEQPTPTEEKDKKGYYFRRYEYTLTLKGVADFKEIENAGCDVFLGLTNSKYASDGDDLVAEIYVDKFDGTITVKKYSNIDYDTYYFRHFDIYYWD